MNLNLNQNEINALCSALNLLTKKDQRDIELVHDVDCGTIYDKLRQGEYDSIRNYWSTPSGS